MALSKSNPKFFETGQISFSDIKNTFGGSGSTNIKASQYLRELSEADLDDDVTTPTIPDSVENSDIAASQSNWNVKAFRGSNKEMVITQSGQEANVSLNENSDIWDGNLNKNIPKRLVINGTVYSTTNTSPALSISGKMQNLDIEVSKSGAVYGEGGATKQNGGDALYIRNLRSSSPVDLYVYGKLWSGGGGGRDGNSGSSGSTLSCSSTNTFDTPNPYTDGRNLSDAAPGKTCRSVTGGNPTGGRAVWYSANQNSVRNRCRGGTRRGSGVASWSAGTKSGHYQCSPNWTITCQETNYFNQIGGSGGNGGTGGSGQGFGRTKNNGNPGNPGNSNTCDGGGTSTGNDGNPGNPGGDWGSAGDRTNAGAAISKRNVRIQYRTSNTMKGREINN